MIEQQYIDLFTQFREELDAHSVKGMNQHRDAAFDTFRQIGFPTSKQEDYKHSNIVRTFDTDLGLNLRNIPIPVNPYDAFKCDVPNLATHLYFLINDRYYDRFQPEEKLPEGVFAGSLQRFSELYPDQFAAHYAQIADYSDNGVVAYNTMFAQDGFVVYVPKNVILEKPLQLINILRGGVNLSVNRRILIIAEENAQVKLLVCDHTVDDIHFVVTQVTEVFAGVSAQVDVYELEENSEKVTRLNNLFSEQKDNSNVVTSSITLHNGYTRNNYRFRLLGQHAEAHAGGLAICDKEQHIDNFAFLDHVSPNCMSNELFKTVLNDRATGVFCGKILVEKDAQKTMAYQNNRNLLASDSAQMFSKPQLEIYADDVKCSHGLTTGQLDEEALFYMRARGIDKDEARLLLMVAFTRDVVDMVRIESLQERLTNLINKRFRGELMRCGSCNVCI
ncbi:MAG: Fe-S cluster assembly protein SufD [Bacteroidetes bacterium GWD2_45_23]|nr:MAG: Fe-S cluster assembly protein SufD [Bacteroidetes bacterium GWC2_46_850]OFX86819.1 MAG: Fe-S cluster assembly protein SufD [Bacteroidetes bacterium GWD2_45_23]HBA99791.1 Fe-S cluster assembly protein SufD [Porphyromonadaceae bacterium]HCC18650.1 Fe-S cluster assembly protein SufD [Porphyromonadaceae bacterium]